MNLTSRSKVWPALFVLLLLAMFAQSAMLYPRLRVKNSEIATLRNAVEAANQTIAERNASTQASAQADELTRLRKDNQELHRLRNEVREMREAAQQVTKSAQAIPSAPAPGVADLVTQLQRQVQLLQAENAQFRAVQQQAMSEQAQARVHLGPCINNLRQIDGAKQQWALENRQTVEALPEVADLEPYLSNPATLSCPAGGVYTLNSVGLPPTCSIPGHALP